MKSMFGLILPSLKLHPHRYAYEEINEYCFYPDRTRGVDGPGGRDCLEVMPLSRYVVAFLHDINNK
jgi:hypothetical protein